MTRYCYRLSRPRDFADHQSWIWAFIFVRSSLPFCPLSPPRLLTVWPIREQFLGQFLVLYPIEEWSELSDSILVSQSYRNHGSCNSEGWFILTILSLNSFKTIDSTEILRADSKIVFSPLSNKRTLRTARIVFGLQNYQAGGSLTWNPNKTTSLKELINPEFHVRFPKIETKIIKSISKAEISQNLNT